MSPGFVNQFTVGIDLRVETDSGEDRACECIPDKSKEMVFERLIAQNSVKLSNLL